LEEFSIDWTKKGTALFNQLEAYRRHRILNNISKIDLLSEQLKNEDIFNHQEFKKIRNRMGSQQVWADRVGVSQATIGNYERNVTYPNKGIRNDFLIALIYFRERETSKLTLQIQGQTIYASEAKQALDESILNSAITDFRFEADEQRIVSYPFDSDYAVSEIATIEQDRKDILEALVGQAADLSLALGQGANANVSRMIEAFTSYKKEAEKDRPNPRRLFRLGTNIYRASVNDDISFALREWDKTAIDGFTSDHRRLIPLTPVVTVS